MVNLKLSPVRNEFTNEEDILVLMPFLNKHNIDPSLQRIDQNFADLKNGGVLM